MIARLDQLPQRLIEVFLQPGDVYFGDRNTRIRTLLGSCVSVVMWHPGLLIGGMCHILLPSRGKHRQGEAADGRYADDAIDMLLQEIRAAGTRPDEYQVKLFGGGNMFPHHAKARRNGPCALAATGAHAGLPWHAGCEDRSVHNCGVGCLNCAAVRRLLQQHGLSLTVQNIGGDGHRQVIFDIATGDTWVRQTPVPQVSPNEKKTDAR